MRTEGGLSGASRTVEPQSQVQDLFLPLLRPVARKFAPSKNSWSRPDLSVCLRVNNYMVKQQEYAVNVSYLIILRVS